MTHAERDQSQGNLLVNLSQWESCGDELITKIFNLSMKYGTNKSSQKDVIMDKVSKKIDLSYSSS